MKSAGAECSCCYGTVYTQAVAGLAKFYRRSPDQITHDEVQAYLLHLIQERKLA